MSRLPAGSGEVCLQHQPNRVVFHVWSEHEALADVPSLMRTSMRNLGGNAFINRTRTPNPMTVVNEHADVVGVTSTVTELMRELALLGGVMKMSARFTTPRLPRLSGCSGSVMGAIRS